MSSPLLRLPKDARVGLAEALDAGRLVPPFSSFALRRYVGSGLAAEVGVELDRLGRAGFSVAQLAITVRLLAEDAADDARAPSRVELVWSGPEELGTASRDTGVVVRELFARAERTVTVAGFAVHQGKQLFKVLADRMAARDLEVRMFLNVQRAYRDTTVSGQIVKTFADKFRRQQWPGAIFPAVFYDPRALDPNEKKRATLHAKCVLVDNRWAFVTSANFTEAAQERNIEAGVLIDDATFAQMLRMQFDGLIAGGKLVRIPGL